MCTYCGKYSSVITCDISTKPSIYNVLQRDELCVPTVVSRVIYH